MLTSTGKKPRRLPPRLSLAEPRGVPPVLPQEMGCAVVSEVVPTGSGGLDTFLRDLSLSKEPTACAPCFGSHQP